jgi:MinD-like ATPase involved in chromosome partitioning or flagellar assembly
MTERDFADDRDYPDGSVGRYVRERWGAIPARAPKADATPPGPATEPDPEADAVPPVPPGSAADVSRIAPPGASAVPHAWPSRPVQDGPLRTGAAGDGPGAGIRPTGRPAPAGPGGAVPPPGAYPVNGPPAAPAPTRPGRGIGPEPVAPHTPPRGNARWVDPASVAAQEAQRARSGSDQDPRDLSSARLLRPTARPPQSGWRQLVYLLSGRLVNPGESPADIRRRELTARINRPLLGCYKIAMLSLKGGVGKTTMTATLGATFASLRGDRVVAVDANPDRGTLSQKIPLETSATVRHLLRDAQRVRRYTDVRAYTSQGPSRLEVLASEQDPAVSEAFSEDDYRRTITLLEHFYNIVLTDCGTGLMHSAMYGVLGVADQLLIVSSGSIDGARSASATMDWLDAHGHGDLVRNSVAVINCVHRSGGVDLDRVAEHFAARCRSVVRIPFDAHLEEGAEVDLDRLEPATRLALLKLAAAVADAFEGAAV